MNTVEQLPAILEALLFAAHKPLNVSELRERFPEENRPEAEEIRSALQQIAQGYAEHGIELKEVASGFRFQVRAEYSSFVEQLFVEKPVRYSRALLETLALVAYRQPITRAEIEDIRGVTVSQHIIKTLLEREWVRVVGHRDVPGKPALFATTKQFLDYFNLKSLSELPPLIELADLTAVTEEFAEVAAEGAIYEEFSNEESKEACAE